MATNSIRSSGTQVNQRGVTQGNTLVDPKSGLPIDVVTDSAGKKRLAVDANFTAQNVEAQVELDYTEDSVQLGDPNTNSTLKINNNGSIDANVEVDAADGDNIAISDGVDTLDVNPDGSINVKITSSSPGELKSFYSEVTSVATSVLTTILTYTAPIAKVTYIQRVELSGSNIAIYQLDINSTSIDKTRTYFGGDLDSDFTFVDSGTGLKINVGDVVTVKVIHTRPDVGDFNARLQVIEV